MPTAPLGAPASSVLMPLTRCGRGTGASLAPVTVMVRVLPALQSVAVQVGVADAGGAGGAGGQVVEGGAGVEAVGTVGGDREAAAIAAGDGGADVAGQAIDGADTVGVAAVNVGVVAQDAGGGWDYQGVVFSGRTGVGYGHRDIINRGDMRSQGDGVGVIAVTGRAATAGDVDVCGAGAGNAGVTAASSTRRTVRPGGVPL